MEKVDPVRCILLTQICYIVIQLITGIPFIIYGTATNTKHICFSNSDHFANACQDLIHDIPYTYETLSTMNSIIIYFITSISLSLCSTTCTGIIYYIMQRHDRRKTQIFNYIDEIDDDIPYYSG